MIAARGLALPEAERARLEASLAGLEQSFRPLADKLQPGQDMAPVFEVAE